MEGAWYACCKGDSYQLYYHTPAATFSRKNRPNAIHYTRKYDRTYFTFADAGKSPEIVYFDRDTGCFTEPVKVGETPLPHDAHGNPSLLIDHEGYLYVFYGSHGTPTLMKRSIHPEDITSWGPEVSIGTCTTYPQAYQVNSTTLLLFYRQGMGQFGFRRSKDKGATWSNFAKLVDFGEGVRIYLISIQGNDGSLHVAWTPWYTHVPIRLNVYYAYSDDEGVTWRAKDDEDLAIPISLTNADLVFNTGSYDTRMDDIQLDEENNPCILTLNGPKLGTETSVLVNWYFSKWNGAEWKTYRVAGGDHKFDAGSLLVVGSTRFRAYLPSGVSQKGEDGGEIQEWTSKDGGLTWAKTRDLTSRSQFSHNYVKTVVNSTSDLRILWSYGDSTPTGSYNTRTSKIYYWGENLRRPQILLKKI